MATITNKDDVNEYRIQLPMPQQCKQTYPVTACTFPDDGGGSGGGAVVLLVKVIFRVQNGFRDGSEPEAGRL